MQLRFDSQIQHPSWGLLLLCCIMVPALGCRALRSRRQTAAQATARQLSRQGAGELQQHKYDDAKLRYQEALGYSDADDRAHRGMAEVYWQQNERELAIEHMATAAKLSGKSPDPDLLVRLGEMYSEQGRYDDALVQADLALNIDRKHCTAWALRGRVLHAQNQFDDALVAYHRALNQRGQFPDVQIAVADIYQNVGRPQRALNTLKGMMDAASDKPMPALAWYIRGQALADLGQQNDARLCLREASLCATEDDTDVLIKVAESQITIGDLAEARHCIGRAMRHDPYNPNVQRVKLALDDSFPNSNAVSSLTGYGQPAPNTPTTEPK